MSKALVISDELYSELLDYAEQQTCRQDDEEFNAYEWSGGNFDDAYELGRTDGRIELAQSIIVPAGGELESAEDGGDV